MLSDPIISWLIALAIATIFGRVMYCRGYNAGGQESSRIICLALDDAGVMSPKKLLQHVEKYWLKLQGSQNNKE